MKRFSLGLALALSLNPVLVAAQEVAGRAIDLPRRPDPAVALSRSLVIPGAGWFYLHSTAPAPGDCAAGIVHLAITVGGVILMMRGARQNKRDLVGVGAGLTFSSRLLDIWGVTEAAAKRRDAR